EIALAEIAAAEIVTVHGDETERAGLVPRVPHPAVPEPVIVRLVVVQELACEIEADGVVDSVEPCAELREAGGGVAAAVEQLADAVAQRLGAVLPQNRRRRAARGEDAAQ